jgi:hypothetical protein
MIDKCESRRIRAEIRRVRFYCVMCGTQSELRTSAAFRTRYDCCLGSLFQLRTTGATDDHIAEYLWRHGMEHVELQLQKEAMDPTVAALDRLRSQKTQGNSTLGTGRYG